VGLDDVRVVVLADTHVRDQGSTRLPPRASEELSRAEVILHAGDVMEPTFLAELRAMATVHAVLGNNDGALRGALPDTLVLDLEGVRVAMIHDSGPRAGRERRLRRRFPDADVVVFGHSHIPWNDEGLDGQLLFNPGSATQRRSQPHRTLGILELAAGRVLTHEVVVVDCETVGSAQSGSSMRASHRPGASISLGVGSVRSSAHSCASPSAPARSTTPVTNAAPRS
jgi:putative phosphoesterase